MKLYSRAKINLFLDIIGQDESDDYHYINSLFQEITLNDEIIIENSSREHDSVTFENVPELSNDSTIHKTLKLLREKFSITDYFDIYVKKNIPVCAGLGGGSSNAATILSFFQERYILEKDVIFQIAKNIGSDVPFFLYGGLCRVSGKGEKIEKLDLKLKDVFFIIIYPKIPVKTSYAYSLIKDKNPSFEFPDLANISVITVDFLRKIVYNKFENFVLGAIPELEMVYSKLKKFLKCEFFFMSGSGSSFVAVYGDGKKRDQDYIKIKETFDFNVSKDEPYYR